MQWGKIYLYFYLVTIFRIILFPVSLLYGFITFTRNKMFDWGILRSVEFPLPIISVGNLSAGGTGKTPFVEYLIRLMKDEQGIATLSRGYKRKSKGFLLADDSSTALDLGDEAFQFKTRYPGVHVAVDENRVHGVSTLLEKKPQPDVILLDDAFQHRWIKPGLSLLLTDFYHLYTSDYMLPTGKLREFRSGAQRADIIVVTKTPRVLSPITRQRVLDQLRPQAHQSVYFSYIHHGGFTRIPGVEFSPGTDYRDHTVLLLAGIANPYPLELFLKDRCTRLEQLYFPDHHQYTKKDVVRITRVFNKIFSKKKIIVTTEKDMVRLIHPDLQETIRYLPICFIPIAVEIHEEDRESFEKQISEYVKNH